MKGAVPSLRGHPWDLLPPPLWALCAELLCGEGGSAGNGMCFQPTLCTGLARWLNLFRKSRYKRGLSPSPSSRRWNWRMMKVAEASRCFAAR